MSLDYISLIDKFCEKRYQLRLKMLSKYKKKSLNIKIKADGSPVTEGDIITHEFLCEALVDLVSCPVVSEESRTHPKILPKNLYWLIDPIDGTRNFIRKTDQFCAAVSLMKACVPLVSFIYSPCEDILYYTNANEDSFKLSSSSKKTKIESIQKKNSDNYIFVQSKSNFQKDLSVVRKNMIGDLIYFGSALKFCLIAEGIADMYVKLGKTAIWDTVAGQHILENAGGHVIDFHGKNLGFALDSLKNKSFIAHGDFRPNLLDLFV